MKHVVTDVTNSSVGVLCLYLEALGIQNSESHIETKKSCQRAF